MCVCISIKVYTSKFPFSQGARSKDGDPGGGGAPKFFSNWLTFAHSPYDADHISASRRGRCTRARYVGIQVHGQAFSSASFYKGEVYTAKMREGI